MLLCVKPRKAVLAPVQAFTYREKHISPGSRNAIEGAIYGMWLWTGYMVYMLIWLGYDCFASEVLLFFTEMAFI